MKKSIFNRVLLLVLAIFGLSSCDNREIIQIDSAEAPILMDLSSSSLYLDSNFPDDQALTVSWSPAKYSIPTEINYKIEISADESFTESAELGGGITQSRTVATYTTAQMNAAAQSLGLEPFVASTMYLRVVAFVGRDGLKQTSNITHLDITPYELVYPDFFLVGEASYVGWTDTEAQLLYKDGSTMTIYTYMQSNGSFRFLGQQAWAPINYSIDKDGTRDEYRYFMDTSENIIQSAGDDENMTFTGETGIYKITIDASKGVQSLKAVASAIPEYDFPEIYLVGNVADNNWSPENGVAMTKVGEGVYEITTDLGADAEFKFVGQKSWGDLEWGNLFDNGDTGYLAPKGDNGNILFAGDGGSYKITVNIKAGIYTIVKQ